MKSLVFSSKSASNLENKKWFDVLSATPTCIIIIKGKIAEIFIPNKSKFRMYSISYSSLIYISNDCVVYRIAEI